MGTVRFTCPNCKKALQAQPDQTAVRCEHCGVAILIEDVREASSRPRERRRSWQIALIAACLLVTLIVWGCLAGPVRVAEGLDATPAPVPEPTAEPDDREDDDIGDEAITIDDMGESEEAFLAAESIGSRVVDRALTKLGCPYVFGKKGSKAFDCSGLVYWAISEVDPDLGERMYTNAAGQAKYCYDAGLLVERSDLQPGDLVFWVYKDCEGCHRWREIHHVGIYAGDGKVIEAAGDKGAVVIRKLWETKDCPILFCGRPYA